MTSKTLKPPADGIDNDQSLQIQRALPLAAGYASRYTDVIPTTGLTAPVRISVTGAETITVPAGAFQTWHTVLDYGSGKHDAWYGQQPPYRSSGRQPGVGAAFELRTFTGGGSASAPTAPTAQPEAAGPERTTPDQRAVHSFIGAVPIPADDLLPAGAGLVVPAALRRGMGHLLCRSGTFILSQIVHLPLNWALGLLGGGQGVALWPLAPMALVAGLSAGLCEEGARWIVLTFFLKQVRRWDQGCNTAPGTAASRRSSSACWP